MRLKSVSYSEIGSNCPSQNIHPAGAKLPANMRISPTYGCAIFSSFLLSLAREDALQGNREVQYQERLHVQVGLTAADVRNGRGVHRHQVLVRRVIPLRVALAHLVAGGDDEVTVHRRGVQGMGVRGD